MSEATTSRSEPRVLSLEHALLPARGEPLCLALREPRLATALTAVGNVQSLRVVLPRRERSLVTQWVFEGDAAALFEELVECDPNALDAVLRHCQGYPSAGASDPEAFVAFLLAGEIETPYAFSAHPAASLRRMRRALDWFDKTLEFQRQLAKAPAWPRETR